MFVVERVLDLENLSLVRRVKVYWVYIRYVRYSFKYFFLIILFELYNSLVEEEIIM